MTHHNDDPTPEDLEAQLDMFQEELAEDQAERQRFAELLTDLTAAGWSNLPSVEEVTGDSFFDAYQKMVKAQASEVALGKMEVLGDMYTAIAMQRVSKESAVTRYKQRAQLEIIRSADLTPDEKKAAWLLLDVKVPVEGLPISDSNWLEFEVSRIEQEDQYTAIVNEMVPQVEETIQIAAESYTDNPNYNKIFSSVKFMITRTRADRQLHKEFTAYGLTSLNTALAYLPVTYVGNIEDEAERAEALAIAETIIRGIDPTLLGEDDSITE